MNEINEIFDDASLLVLKDLIAYHIECIKIDSATASEVTMLTIAGTEEN